MALATHRMINPEFPAQITSRGSRQRLAKRSCSGFSQNVDSPTPSIAITG
jgi:hypothetical protein